MAILKSKHAFGSLSGISAALEAGTIDEYDILFLDGGTDNPKIGWIDKNGDPVIVEGKDQVVRVTELPTENGDENVVYLFKNKGYVWDTTEGKCISMAESADVTALTEKVETLETQIATKVDEDYVVADKPEGTLVDYREKEIRVMCPADTDWQLRTSGENADANAYYIGVKAYAPDGAVSFKEDTAKTISDDTMYYFEGNDFAGVEEDGRKYSIFWLPVAVYDSENDAWTYYGAKSTESKYIGWYYSVEWYDADGEIIDSDCIRINLANESNYSTVTPFYVNDAVTTAKNYTDEQIAAKIAEASSVEVVEF